MKEQTWIAFAGSYLGAIIGAIGAIIIMFRTINEGRKEKIENRKYAEFLYIRDIVDDVISTIDDSTTLSTIAKLKELNDSGFTFIPDIQLLNRESLSRKSQDSRIKRAIAQSIIHVNGDVSKALFDSLEELDIWELAFYEFAGKISNFIKGHTSLWELDRVSALDELYDCLQGCIANEDYLCTLGDNDLPCPIKYSFVDGFLGVKNEPNLVIGPHGGFTSSAIVSICDGILRSFQSAYEKITAEINMRAEGLLAALKKGLVLCE